MTEFRLITVRLLDTSMNWNDNTLNPKVIAGYYKSAPSLKLVNLHRVSLLRDGPVAEIVFDVSDFPEKPSSKWPAGANTCQITLRALGVSEVELTSWSAESSGSFEIESVRGAVEIRFIGEAKFRFLCSHLDVVGVSGYVNGQA